MLAADAHTLCSSKAFIHSRSSPGTKRASSSSTGVSSPASGAFHIATAAGADAAAAAAGVFDSRAALLDAIVDSSYPKQLQPAAAGGAAADDGTEQAGAEPAATAAVMQLAQALGAASGVPAHCPASVHRCVRISAVPPQQHTAASSSIGISNNMGAAHKASYADITIDSGGSSGSSTESQAADSATTAAAASAFPGFSADIHPGLSQQLLLPRSEWLSYMVRPPSINTLGYMHYLGRVDAYVWANSTGLIKAAVAEQQQQLTGLLLRDVLSVDRVDALFQKFVDWQPMR
jgi:hypothetical protein